MDIEALRYVIVIEQLGSYSRAAKQLFVSQPAVSRAVTALENEMGFQVFRRSNKGVVPTEDGKNLINRIRPLIKELDQMSRKSYINGTDRGATLMVATQRCWINSLIFAKFAQEFCMQMDMSNLVFLEKPTDDVLTLVAEGGFDVGILHCTSNQRQTLMDKTQKLDLKSHLLEESRVCVQVRKGHPLAGRTSVKTKDLERYPRITYVNEDVTEYNSCSETMLFNPEVQKKRILVSDRGSMRDMLDGTDGFYVGCDYSHSPLAEPLRREYIPLEEADYTINTIWFSKNNYQQNRLGKRFVEMLEMLFKRIDETDI